MGEYFRHARADRARLGRVAARRPAAGRHAPARPASAGTSRSPATASVSSTRRRRRADRRWLETFRLALADGCPVSEQALDCIEQNVDRYTADDFVGTEAIASSCARCSTRGPGLYARLSEMHDCGLLNQIFPEFEKIHCRVIRDFYHRYTVDEHTLLTIRDLESLWHPSDAPGASASRRCSRSCTRRSC